MLSLSARGIMYTRMYGYMRVNIYALWRAHECVSVYCVSYSLASVSSTLFIRDHLTQGGHEYLICVLSFNANHSMIIRVRARAYGLIKCPQFVTCIVCMWCLLYVCRVTIELVFWAFIWYTMYVRLPFLRCTISYCPGLHICCVQSTFIWPLPLSYINAHTSTYLVWNQTCRYTNSGRDRYSLRKICDVHAINLVITMNIVFCRFIRICREI